MSYEAFLAVLYLIISSLIVSKVPEFETFQTGTLARFLSYLWWKIFVLKAFIALINTSPELINMIFLVLYSFVQRWYMFVLTECAGEVGWIYYFL